MSSVDSIVVKGASQHNLKGIDLTIPRNAITVITGVSGSGKSSLAFDTILAEAQRRFFYTLSNYTRQFLDVATRPEVLSVQGLSPAIALAQNETPPSRRATVATMSDLGELLGVLFARFGIQSCPEHRQLTVKMTPTDIAERMTQDFQGKVAAIVAPIVDNKKGHFRTRFEKFAKLGYMKAIVDGALIEIVPTPELSKEKKHTIKLLIDTVKVSESNLARLARSIESASVESGGGVEVCPVTRGRPLNPDELVSYSTRGGCPTCGFAWPRLDSRYFAAGSLGRCQVCNGYGELDADEDTPEGDTRLDQADSKCSDCSGTGLKPDLNAIEFKGVCLPDLYLMSLKALKKNVASWLGEDISHSPALERVLQEIHGVLVRLEQVGLTYLHPARRITSLSGGEAQRLRLSSVLGEHLRGVLYVLDEPSQGLHAAELDKIIDFLKVLRDQGNTVIVVDHDEHIMRQADFIVDLGPGGGASGGQLLASFKPNEASQFASVSKTAFELSKHSAAMTPLKRLGDSPGVITIKKPRLHNLAMPDATFQLGALNIVSGISGAGKTSLVKGVLYENLKAMSAKTGKYKPRYCDKIISDVALDRVVMVDRKPVAKSSVSMPVSYLGALTPIRELYAAIPEAQIAGLTARSFSLQVEGGRCEECGGRGESVLSMRFLPDARVPCDLCEGMRFRPHVLQVKYSGYSIGEVLNLTIDEAYDLFKRIRRIEKVLKPAVDMGLGYLKMGQPTASLSGGEAQRLKLAPIIGKRYGPDTILVMDEPTRGLHASDGGLLLVAIEQLLLKGVTVVVIEHSLDMIRSAHWVVEVGPGSAELGGHLIYQGIPEGLKKVKESQTRPYLN